MSDEKGPTFHFNNNFKSDNVNLAQGQNVTINVTQPQAAELSRVVGELQSLLATLPQPAQDALSPAVQDASAAVQEGNWAKARAAFGTVLTAIGATADVLSLGEVYPAIVEVAQHALTLVGG